ncbi:MAG: hypothetical protein AAGF11_28275 [Myxococcota bacterium]
MTVDMRGVSKALVIGVALGATGISAGCSGGAATPTERLWVSKIPTKPTQSITAFLTMSTDEDRYLGAFFRGTLLRGGHDVFMWENAGKDSARLKFLQDNVAHDLKLRACKPDTGFDYCLEVLGDPTGTVEYHSRKRWVVRRPGRKRDATLGLVTGAMLEFAEDDPELAAVLDTVAATSEGASE